MVMAKGIHQYTEKDCQRNILFSIGLIIAGTLLYTVFESVVGVIIFSAGFSFSLFISHEYRFHTKKEKRRKTTIKRIRRR